LVDQIILNIEGGVEVDLATEGLVGGGGGEGFSVKLLGQGAWRTHEL
jgi:hypothetical protein